MPGSMLDERRHCCGAERLRERTTGAETATGRRIDRAPRFALQDLASVRPCNCHVGNRNRGDQIARIRVQRLRKERRSGRYLRYLAEMQHHDAI